MNDLLDWASAVTVIAGFIITGTLLLEYGRKYRRSHERWAFRAVAMLATVMVVWFGSGSTLAGRMGLIPTDIAQWFAFGSRLTLLSLALWLLLLPAIPDDHKEVGRDR